ncbi:MAG: NUDIX domain-containing protein [Candidatus Paceibacterota bacterium]
MIKGERNKLKPCVGVMIWKDGKVIVGKRKGSHGSGEYAFPGGHLEFDESFVECAKREVLEETGIVIKNVIFMSVANYRRHDNRQDILVNLVADWESGEETNFPDEKIGDWQWCMVDSLPSPLFYPTQITLDSFITGKNFYDKE